MSSVFLGMSGGVDSAVAAARLVDRGHDVVPVHILLSDSDAGGARERVHRLCRHLRLPLVERDLRDLFRREIVDPFLATYRKGETPNPCIRCNERVKFPSLLDVASDRDDRIATGHYVRIVLGVGGDGLLRAVDRGKDQSYVLYRLDPALLPRLIFPLGMSTKTEVLEEARRRFGDLFDDVAESNDLCFLSSARRKALLRSIPGPIVDREGRHVGRHDGIGLYTVGQRKGLGLAGGPWYVVEIDAEGGCVVVGRKEDLFVRSVYALFPSWHRRPAPGEIFQAQHRYRTEPCRVRMDHVDDRSFSVTYLDRPQPVAPGQSLVLYDGERVLGGGVITKQEEGKTGA